MELTNYELMDCLGNWEKIKGTSINLYSTEKESYYKDDDFKEEIIDWYEIYQDLKYDNSRPYRFFLIKYKDEAELLIRVLYNKK